MEGVGGRQAQCPTNTGAFSNQISATLSVSLFLCMKWPSGLYGRGRTRLKVLTTWKQEVEDNSTIPVVVLAA